MTNLPVCEPLLAGNELRYVTNAVETGWISSAGEYVELFENFFAEWCGVEHGVAVCNGTAALHLTLMALGIGPGDEVIVPDFTMIASAAAVCHAGAMPVFVDADPLTWNIAPAKIQAAITSKTKAIMAVHIFGNPCDMDALSILADDHGLVLLEDAAEAHGATFKGAKAGSLSRVAAFSFFANKNITTGEGGMVVTRDPKLARAARYYRNLCFPQDAPRTYLHDHIGYNYRMSNLHAAIGFAQMEKADHYRALRIKNGRLYRELFADITGISVQSEQPGGCSVHWMNGLVVTAEYGRTRDELVTYLKMHGIDSRLFFNGMHRQPALMRYGCDCGGEFSVSDYLADNGLYLPSGSGLNESDIRQVCKVIKEFARN